VGDGVAHDGVRAVEDDVDALEDTAARVTTKPPAAVRLGLDALQDVVLAAHEDADRLAGDVDPTWASGLALLDHLVHDPLTPVGLRGASEDLVDAERLQIGLSSPVGGVALSLGERKLDDAVGVRGLGELYEASGVTGPMHRRPREQHEQGTVACDAGGGEGVLQGLLLGLRLSSAQGHQGDAEPAFLFSQWVLALGHDGEDEFSDSRRPDS